MLVHLKSFNGTLLVELLETDVFQGKYQYAIYPATGVSSRRLISISYTNLKNMYLSLT